MRKQRKNTATIIPFPKHLTSLPRSSAMRGRTVQTPKGHIELYSGANGMVLIDALVPAAVAARMLAGAERQSA